MIEQLVFLAVEEAVPADHPVAILAIPIGMLFLSGSIYLLLWSNYGVRKALAIYGTAFFGLSFLLGVFWWFGGPGISTNNGVDHLPGQTAADYSAQWYAFEEGSPRASFFPNASDRSAYQTAEEYLGLADLDEEALEDEPSFGQLAGSLGQAIDSMQQQFLPVDDNGIAQIGVTRRQAYEEEAAAARPDDAAGRARPFFNVRQVDDPLVTDHPQTGVLLATQRFQATATFTDESGVPFEPIPLGDPVDWYAFYDPGAPWIPAAVWTGISLVLFLLSLVSLDRLEAREKRLATQEVEEPETIAQPVAQ